MTSFFEPAVLSSIFTLDSLLTFFLCLRLISFLGEVDDFSFFYCSSPFHIFKMNFRVLFPYLIKYYNILSSLLLYFD